ncbi:MAG: hypothetical protein AUK47_09020 [Deltaproteobacteria bacterium CG2_30_63_29]|nr:MAG: hypothetical protein AUK47_09020 [Deltaproteobacteria bacterium CG2_30_63_29]
MTLDELFALSKVPTPIELSQEDLTRLYWKHRGLLKSQGRDQRFWDATNKNLRLAYERLDEKERQLGKAYSIIQEDLQVATRIQAALLPVPTSIMERDLEIAVYHKQLTEVGGDYYDFFTDESEAADGRNADGYAIGVFDISGHGVSAALVMTYLKAMFAQQMLRSTSPKDIVRSVNEAAFDFLRGIKKYATVNFVKFASKKIQYVCGGGFGLVVHGQEVFHFERKDPFLGLRDRAFRQYEIPFVTGDLLALYTDGMVESQDAEGQDYTARRLNDLIALHADRAVGEIVQCCVDDYRAFRATDIDDVTLLVMRRKEAL